jgi:hypothetical protein
LEVLISAEDTLATMTLGEKVAVVDAIASTPARLLELITNVLIDHPSVINDLLIALWCHSTHHI